MQKRIYYTILFALVLSISIAFLQDKNCSFSVCQGDFPAFYSAAKIVQSNQVSELYSADLQAKIQHQYWPSLGEKYLYYAYPPIVAIVLSPLAYFSPINAKIIFLLVSTFFIFLGAKVVCFKFDFIQRLEFFILLLTFPFNFLGLMSGQLVGLNILLFSLINRACFEQKGKWCFVLGVALGVLFYKPNLFLVTFVFVALLGMLNTFVLTISAILILLSIGLSTYFFGSYEWIAKWLTATSFFWKQDIAVNGFQSFSLIETYYYLRQSFNNSYILQFALLVYGVLYFLSLLKLRADFLKSERNFLQFQILFFVFSFGCILLNTHAIFYELSLASASLLLVITELHNGINRFLRVMLLYAVLFFSLLLRESMSILVINCLITILCLYLAVNSRQFFLSSDKK